MKKMLILMILRPCNAVYPASGILGIAFLPGARYTVGKSILSFLEEAMKKIVFSTPASPFAGRQGGAVYRELIRRNK
jgi:hypothetical protein